MFCIMYIWFVMIWTANLLNKMCAPAVLLNKNTSTKGTTDYGYKTGRLLHSSLNTKITPTYITTVFYGMIL